MTAEARRDAALQLLADVNDRPETTDEQQVLIQAAIAHALLGLLEMQIGQSAKPEARRRVAKRAALDRVIEQHGEALDKLAD